MGNLIHLQWLDICGTSLSKEDLESICKLYFLQIILLQECSIKEIPREIGNLVQLRYLDLSENEELKELPESICSLLRLQTLDIQWCKNLCRFPVGIHRLENLKHLLVNDTSMCHLPQGVGELSGLRTLQLFHGGCGWNKLGLLNKLNRLTGSLELKIMVSGDSDLEELVEDAVEAGLRNKTHLHTLRIQFTNQSRGEEEPPSLSSSLWVDIIEALEPHHNLKSLGIDGYKGWRLPHWISSPLNHVRYIWLNNFFWLSSLPPLGKLPFLEFLELERVGGELKMVGIRGSSNTQGDTPSSSSSSTNSSLVAFPKLKYLTFLGCDNWEEWEDITAEEEESPAIHLMPSLIRLTISSCIRLKKLPYRLLRKANSLQQLDIWYSFELKKTYEDEDGSARRSISQNNTKLRLSIF